MNELYDVIANKVIESLKVDYDEFVPGKEQLINENQELLKAINGDSQLLLHIVEELANYGKNQCRSFQKVATTNQIMKFIDYTTARYTAINNYKNFKSTKTI